MAVAMLALTCPAGWLADDMFAGTRAIRDAQESWSDR